MRWIAVPVIALTVIAVLTVETAETRAAESKEIAKRARSVEPSIRVNVTPVAGENIVIEVRGQVRVFALDTNAELGAEGISGKNSLTASTTGFRLGSKRFDSKKIEIRPVNGPAVGVNGHLYRGNLRLIRRGDDSVLVVNVLPVEEYLASVVDSEMPLAFPEAARVAQAIVARTFALYQAEHAEPDSVCDVLATRRGQQYNGVEYLDASGRRLAGESENSRRIVKSTRGIVCTNGGSLVCTYYSAVCGGRTTDGRELFKDATDVHKSVPCEWCRASPYYRWKTEISQDDFETRTGFRWVSDSRGHEKQAVPSMRQVVEPGRGLISRFEFRVDQKTQPISGVELRDQLPSGILYSPHFRMKQEADRVIFEGQGHGHGVGLCQWGAKGQAEAGRDGFEIVRSYYSSVELTDLNY